MALSTWGKKLGDLAQSTVEKSKALAETTKLNIANSNLEDDIRKLTEEIGRYVLEHELLREDEKILELMDKIESIKATIQANNEQIQAIKNQNTCAQCGAEISKSSKFCDKCGSPIPREAAPQEAAAAQPVCKQCSAPLEAGAVFCGECGTNQTQ